MLYGWFLTSQRGVTHTKLKNQVVSVLPAQYFKAKRGIANGIVYAGGGLGGTVISFILDALLQSVGIAWTFRILGFMIMGTGLPAETQANKCLGEHVHNSFRVRSTKGHRCH